MPLGSKKIKTDKVSAPNRNGANHGDRNAGGTAIRMEAISVGERTMLHRVVRQSPMSFALAFQKNSHVSPPASKKNNAAGFKQELAAHWPGWHNPAHIWHAPVCKINRHFHVSSVFRAR
jgi:hypothetical protein